MALLLDTGPIYSSIDRSDPDHNAVVETLRKIPRPHFVIAPVLVEVDYWIRKLLDVTAFVAFVSDIDAGRYELVPLESGDLVRAASIERQYLDLNLGFVDAALVAVSERLDVDQMLSFDRRHFRAVRPAHRPSFRLLPENE